MSNKKLKTEEFRTTVAKLFDENFNAKDNERFTLLKEFECTQDIDTPIKPAKFQILTDSITLKKILRMSWKNVSRAPLSIIRINIKASNDNTEWLINNAEFDVSKNTEGVTEQYGIIIPDAADKCTVEITYVELADGLYWDKSGEYFSFSVSAYDGIFLTDANGNRIIETKNKPQEQSKKKSIFLLLGLCVAGAVAIVTLVLSFGLFDVSDTSKPSKPTMATTATTKPENTTTSTTKPVNTTGTIVTPSELVIFLDPGHGGTDVGSTREFDFDGDGTKETYNESEIALVIALKAKEKLEKLGYTVVLSREDNDTTVSLADRSNAAIEAKANMFISIHVNSYGFGGQTAVSGFEAYYTGRDTIEYDGKAFADLFTKEFEEIKNITNDAGYLAYPKMNIRGTKSDEDLYGEGNHLAVLNPMESYIPSTLLELGYITNDGDLSLFRSTYWQHFAAEAIADAVVAAHQAGIYKAYNK